MSDAITKLKERMRTWWVTRRPNGRNVAAAGIHTGIAPILKPGYSAIKLTDLDADKVLDALTVACEALKKCDELGVYYDDEDGNGNYLKGNRAKDAQAEIAKLLEGELCPPKE